MFSEMMLDYSNALFVVWALDWVLVAVYYGSNSRRAWSVEKSDSQSAFQDFLRVTAWAFLGPIWPRAREWDPNSLPLPKDYIKLQFGIFLASAASGILALNAFLRGRDLMHPWWSWLMVDIAIIISCLGALTHLVVALHDRIRWWRTLYVANVIAPIIYAIVVNI